VIPHSVFSFQAARERASFLAKRAERKLSLPQYGHERFLRKLDLGTIDLNQPKKQILPTGKPDAVARARWRHVVFFPELPRC
jgi:hypothetical protein